MSLSRSINQRKMKNTQTSSTQPPEEDAFILFRHIVGRIVWGPSLEAPRQSPRSAEQK